MLRALTCGWGLIRDGWLILGLSLLLLAGLEASYRGQGALRRYLFSAVSAENPPHPYHAAAWWNDFGDALVAFKRSAPRFDPYRGWWPVEFSSRWLNIDAAGLRHTVQAGAHGRSSSSVFMLGGSTMWGFTQRDAATIPSRLAARAAGEGSDVSILNLAQPGFTLGQGTATLIRWLRRGEVPELAIFLDGINEVGVVSYGEAPGMVYNQRELRERTWRDTTSDLLARIAASVELGTRLSRLVKGLPMTGRDLRTVATGLRPYDYHGEGRALSTEEMRRSCERIAEGYRNLVVLIQSIAREHHFQAVFFWQPSLAISRKKRSEWEQSAEARAGPIAPLLRGCIDRVRTEMAVAKLHTDVGFHDLSPMFDDSTETVFLDSMGHVTEDAADRIAQEIWSRTRHSLTRPTSEGPPQGVRPIRARRAP